MTTDWRARLLAVSGTEAWWTVYGVYLKSPQWAKLRAVVLKRADGRCEDCGECAPTQVHHLTYRRVGNEREEDLRALCNDCHDRRHGWHGLTFAERWALATDPTRGRAA